MSAESPPQQENTIAFVDANSDARQWLSLPLVPLSAVAAAPPPLPFYKTDTDDEGLSDDDNVEDAWRHVWDCMTS